VRCRSLTRYGPTSTESSGSLSLPLPLAQAPEIRTPVRWSVTRSRRGQPAEVYRATHGRWDAHRGGSAGNGARQCRRRHARGGCRGWADRRSLAHLRCCDCHCHGLDHRARWQDLVSTPTSLPRRPPARCGATIEASGRRRRAAMSPFPLQG